MTEKNNPDEIAVFNFMKSKESRDFIWSHLQSCGVFSSTFDSDPIKHAYLAGKRDAGLSLNSRLKDSAPSEYMIMTGENVDG